MGKENKWKVKMAKRTTRRPHGVGGPIILEPQDYWVENKEYTKKFGTPIWRPIHGRCLNKLIEKTREPSEVERLSRAFPVEAGRRDLKCYICDKPIWD